MLHVSRVARNDRPAAHPPPLRIPSPPAQVLPQALQDPFGAAASHLPPDGCAPGLPALANASGTATLGSSPSLDTSAMASRTSPTMSAKPMNVVETHIVMVGHSTRYSSHWRMHAADARMARASPHGAQVYLYLCRYLQSVAVQRTRTQACTRPRMKPRHSTAATPACLPA